MQLLPTLAEEVNGINLYAYCGNNPVMAVDPNGTWSWKAFWKVVGAVAIVAAITIAIVFTAGGAAIALGASATMINSIVAGATLGGLLMGGGEIIHQIKSYGAENINLGSVAIEALSGSLYGAMAGISAVTNSPGVYFGVKAGRVALSGLTAYLHGRADGLSRSESLKKGGFAALGSAVIQMLFSVVDISNGYSSAYGLQEGTILGRRGAFGLKQEIVQGTIMSGRIIWRHLTETFGGFSGVDEFFGNLLKKLILKILL